MNPWQPDVSNSNHILLGHLFRFIFLSPSFLFGPVAFVNVKPMLLIPNIVVISSSGIAEVVVCG